MSGQALDLKRSAQIVWRLKGLVATIIALGFLSGAAYTALSPAVYQSRAAGRDLALGLDRRPGGGGDQPAGPRLGAQRRRPGCAADRPARPRPHRGRGAGLMAVVATASTPARPSAPPTSSPAAMSPTPRRAAA